MKTQTTYSSFEALEMRVGQIIKVEHSLSTKPTYRLTINFGNEIGTKVSCGAYTNYQKEDLVGKQIIGIVNFPPKKMGPEVSEVLVLGVKNVRGETIYLTPQAEVALGEEVF